MGMCMCSCVCVWGYVGTRVWVGVDVCVRVCVCIETTRVYGRVSTCVSVCLEVWVCSCVTGWVVAFVSKQTLWDSWLCRSSSPLLDGGDVALEDIVFVCMYVSFVIRFFCPTFVMLQSKTVCVD